MADSFCQQGFTSALLDHSTQTIHVCSYQELTLSTVSKQPMHIFLIKRYYIACTVLKGVHIFLDKICYSHTLDQLWYAPTSSAQA